MLCIAVARFVAVLVLVTSAACGNGDSTPLPCDVDAVLESKCRVCHLDPPDFGAPMSLVTWEDTQDVTPTGNPDPVWERMQFRISDALRPMPPSGLQMLVQAERDILEAWFAAGAPAGDAACR
jgi:uncharacterized membrane protein